MAARLGLTLIALLIGSSAGFSAELYLPTKGGIKYGHPAAIRSVGKSHRPSPQNGASLEKAHQDRAAQ